MTQSLLMGRRVMLRWESSPRSGCHSEGNVLWELVFIDLGSHNPSQAFIQIGNRIVAFNFIGGNPLEFCVLPVESYLRFIF